MRYFSNSGKAPLGSGMVLKVAKISTVLPRLNQQIACDCRYRSLRHEFPTTFAQRSLQHHAASTIRATREKFIVLIVSPRHPPRHIRTQRHTVFLFANERKPPEKQAQFCTGFEKKQELFLFFFNIYVWCCFKVTLMSWKPESSFRHYHAQSGEGFDFQLVKTV
jgi:hypothetical protein